MSRCIRWPFFVGLFLAVSLLSSFELAQGQAAGPKDAAAIRLVDEAMNTDYLGMKFPDAEKKLRRALTTCGANGCSAAARARVHRSLGVVLVAGLNKAEEGKAQFAEAQKLDPNTPLEKDFVTPEIDKAWQAAKSGGGAGAGAEPADTGGGTDEPASPTAPGELNHTPPTEQMNLTPVPVFVELPRSMGAARVVVRYRPAGMSEWKKIEAARMTKGYGAEIPCADVGSVTGDLSYYVEALDSSGQVLATSGSRTRPHRVPIKNELAGEPPHLPGRPPSARCADTDCPPGLPGCKSKKIGGKSWGATCESDGECAEGLACKKGTCESGGGTVHCDADVECEFGQSCVDHLCDGGEGGGTKKTWLSLGVQQDFMLLGTANNVCSVGGSNSYECVAIDGFTYGGNPNPEEPGNRIQSGGFKLANTRILLGIDRLIGDNIMLGLRVGYAFNSAPSTSMAFHLEARATYWFGQKPFATPKIRPFAGFIAGMAEVDIKLKVPVVEQDGVCKPENLHAADNEGTPVFCATPVDSTDPTTFDPANQGTYNNHGEYIVDDSGGQMLTVWRRNRNIFAGITGGVMIPISGSRHAIVPELKLFLLFPNSGFTLSPAVSYMFGF